MSDTKKNRKKGSEVKELPNEIGTFEPGYFVGGGETMLPVTSVFDDVDYRVGVYSRNGIVPKFATEGSACFDFVANFGGLDYLDSYSAGNQKTQHKIRPSTSGPVVILEPGDRVMIPTGLWFDLPEQTVLQIYARSGLSLKKGLVPANGVGVVDSDYVDEVFIIMTNTTRSPVVISDGDRIAQGMISYTTNVSLVSMNDKPSQKTDRSGGFGSTGV